MRPNDKIVTSYAEISSICDAIRKLGKKIVLTHGCFDLIHAGHAEYLCDAAACGDYLIVGVNSDQFVRLLKGQGRPVRKEEDRAFIIASMFATHFVMVFDNRLDLIQAVKPHVYVTSSTSHVLAQDDNERVTLLENIEAEIIVLDSKRPNISSTEIIGQFAHT